MGALTRLVLSRPESLFAHDKMENGKKTVKKRCHYNWKTVKHCWKTVKKRYHKGSCVGAGS